jgi:kumamolisin
MAFDKKIDLPGSERKAPKDAKQFGTLDMNATATVTIVLRRRGNDPAVTPSGSAVAVLSRTDFAKEYGASAEDIQLVEQFANANHLSVVQASLEKRSVLLLGTLAQLSKTFNAKLKSYRYKGSKESFRARTGLLRIPSELKGVVTAVLGLDSRLAARTHFRTLAARATSSTFTPPQVAELYSFPKGLTGAGQTVGIVELGGGYTTSDLQTYFTGLGLKTQPKVTAVSVDGGKNTPGGQADGEVELDIEVIGSIAPGANIAVYFAPNTDQGFVDAITDAVHDTVRTPSVVSVSWGQSEDDWTAQARTAMNAALQDAATLGVTVTLASGDDGSTDGDTDGKLHVDFPASSPYVLACGGTKLSGSGSKITSEIVWNETAAGEGATGGGISNAFALPTYQSNAGVPVNPETNFAGRGVPDVAGNADPVTGYKVRVDKKNIVVGGTSAVAPLWAALIALINQKLGTPVGFLNPKIYALTATAFHDITSGNNDDGGLGQYSAKSGWDACTGLGSPNGTALLGALSLAKSAKAAT